MDRILLLVLLVLFFYFLSIVGTASVVSIIEILRYAVARIRNGRIIASGSNGGKIRKSCGLCSRREMRSGTSPWVGLSLRFPMKSEGHVNGLGMCAGMRQMPYGREPRIRGGRYAEES
jgi:hypothetical protein